MFDTCCWYVLTVVVLVMHWAGQWSGFSIIYFFYILVLEWLFCYWVLLWLAVLWIQLYIHYHILILCARGGYLSNFILKWLTQKLDLGNRDWFAIAIHDPKSRLKGVQTLKRPWIFKVWSWAESFYDSSKLNGMGFSFWVIELIILIFRV